MFHKCRILQVSDPNVFASLTLLNPKWRRVSQQAHLYARQLSRCPSYSLSHKSSASSTISNEDLPELKRLFAKEVKQNLFDAYLRPNQTVIKIISNSISSSSAPGGEGIQFASSPKGYYLLAYNSSRIYVVNTRRTKIEVERELKILRRPAATYIDDEGSMLVVLLTDMQVDIYNLLTSPPRRTQSIILDHSPRAIAVSPCGSVLAAAYEGGIEVLSLKSTALETDRRAVKCDAVDALSFSFDGTQILGTTFHSPQPNTVILTAPYYDPGSHMEDDDKSALWTTSILFPNSSRDCSHAVLIQNGRQEEAGWTFTYDRSFETFRAVRVEDLRNGTTYFTGPSPISQAKLIPCTLPAASYNGDLVTAGFQGKDIWLYGIPDDLDAVADQPSNVETGASTGGLHRRISCASARSPSRSPEDTDTIRVPQWQILCDKLRNTFVSGVKIAELDGVNVVKWVAGFGDSYLKERLLIAARGAMPPKPITEQDDIDFVDGGRLILVDFDYGVRDGKRVEISIEVGTREPEVLEEETRDLDTEVAIVRRRTVAQRRGGPGTGARTAVIRSTTSATRPQPPDSGVDSQISSLKIPEDTDDDPLLPRRIGQVPQEAEPQHDDLLEEGETESAMEEQEALDAPYSHASPRSGTTLRRAATAAAVTRRLHPSAATAGHVEYRRADGRREHPHESDADNWVPPPPPYQKEDPEDLPAFLRHCVQGATAMPPIPPLPDSVGTPAPPSAPMLGQTVPPQLVLDPEALLGDQAEIPDRQAFAQEAVQQAKLEPDSMLQPSRAGDDSRAISNQSRSGLVDAEDIYNVSPPGSPTMAARRTASPARSASRVISNETTISQESSVSPESPETSRRAPPSVPHIQTIAASPNSPQAPAFDRLVPSASRTASWNQNASPVASPKPRPLSNAQTWSNPADTMLADMQLTDQPYSAPPADTSPGDMLAASLPPAPRADQLARLSARTGQTPRRLSGGYHINRVPVGSKPTGDHGSRRSSIQQPSQRYSSQQQDYYQEFQEQSQQWAFSTPSEHASLSGSQSQLRRLSQSPVEDVPLIVSTPRGITGAFDPPTRQTSGRRAEPLILAPVPRRPRSSSNQAAVLRPTVERLETIYSVASATSATMLPVVSSTSNTHATYLLAPTGSASTTVRVPSLNRKQSRAERSAAKNIADAKKRGWNGRKRGGKKTKERDIDVASSAAWTDVTTTSGMSGFTGMFSGSGKKGKGVAKTERGGGEGEGDEKGGKKCVVM